MSKKREAKPAQPERAKVIKGKEFDPSRYEIDDRARPFDGTVATARTVADVVKLAESDKNIQIDALVLHTDNKGGYKFKRLKRESFLEAFRNPKPVKLLPMRENSDPFLSDGPLATAGGPLPGGYSSANAGLVGDDYVPLLGGPFNKQLYLYDFQKMCALSFQAYNHDPFARAIVHITRDFALGRGYRVDSQDLKALALWHAFEEANDLQTQMDQFCRESSIYGEHLWWWLPDNQTKITYQTQNIPTGKIPRVRLMDPSACWEVVTYPEDITRVLNYTFIYPTQYQIFGGKDGDENVPTTKFIIQQIPASQIMHRKLNSVSNEKRGRSDLYPILGDLKRLRDSVDYSLLAMQKATAWAIDTTIEGSIDDVANYASEQEALGTLPPAGSEFVHTSKVKREYLGNSGASHGGDNLAFEWCLNKIAAGAQIPISYFGTHVGGGATRASALVGTEPVAKKMRGRQIFIEETIRKLWAELMRRNGMDADCEVTLPELLSQDRSAKIKDVKLAEDCGYIARSRAATIVAKELEITEYDYDTEKVQIAEEQDPPLFPSTIAPLTAPAQAEPTPSAASGSSGGAADADKRPATANTGNLRRALSMGKGA